MNKIKVIKSVGALPEGTVIPELNPNQEGMKTTPYEKKIIHPKHETEKVRAERRRGISSKTGLPKQSSRLNQKSKHLKRISLTKRKNKTYGVRMKIKAMGVSLKDEPKVANYDVIHKS